MILTTNKQDQSGEEIKVSINQVRKTFTLYEYEITLVEKERYENSKYPGVFYDIMCKGIKGRLGIVVHYLPSERQRESIEAFHNDISEDNLLRTGKNIFEAAIRMLRNVL